MHLTLHLTARCNFRCRYCYAAPHTGGDMSLETARAAVRLAAETCRAEDPEQSVGIIFFGGEPLLRRELIEEVVRDCRAVSRETGQILYYKLTTNGSLLDETFLTRDPTSEIFIALSHDGVPAAHDTHRVDTAGAGTFHRLQDAVSLLLRHKPYSPVMLVTTPDTVMHYATSVDYLFRRGFRYLICSLDYSGAWNENSLNELRRQYDLLARWYETETEREAKFYFSPFDTKIASHVFPGSCRRERCELGRRQISVAPSGELFPCVQFVGDPAFSIGHVRTGIDEARRAALYQRNGLEKRGCEECAIRERCNHFCGCLNRQSTGSIDDVSPVLCAHERMTLAAADRVAERLFRRRAPMFVQKQYNQLFPLVSLAEDQHQSSDLIDQ